MVYEVILIREVHILAKQQFIKNNGHTKMCVPVQHAHLYQLTLLVNRTFYYKIFIAVWHFVHKCMVKNYVSLIIGHTVNTQSTLYSQTESD